MDFRAMQHTNIHISLLICGVLFSASVKSTPSAPHVMGKEYELQSVKLREVRKYLEKDVETRLCVALIGGHSSVDAANWIFTLTIVNRRSTPINLPLPTIDAYYPILDIEFNGKDLGYYGVEYASAAKWSQIITIPPKSAVRFAFPIPGGSWLDRPRQAGTYKVHWKFHKGEVLEFDIKEDGTIQIKGD
jgi:hypothetical protein